MISINGKDYEVIENVKNALDEEILKIKLTEYYESYDYIVGDWAYGKLRLKGFNEKNNPNYNKINDASLIKSYIKDYCAYDCKYFILKRVSVDKKN